MSIYSFFSRNVSLSSQDLGNGGMKDLAFLISDTFCKCMLNSLIDERVCWCLGAIDNCLALRTH